MNRRDFLATLGGAACLAGVAPLAAESRPRAPFRMLYGNDTTNVLSCTSPWHAKGAPLTAQLIEATVDEVAGTGVDAHLLQPGLGWVPMWPSRVVPLEEHYRWMKQRYGLGPDSFGRFVLGGGDPVKTFVERCRARGQAPFVSFRLNDLHHKDQVYAPPGAKLPGSVAMSLTQFYVEHPEWRLGSTAKLAELGQDWAVPEVRAHKLALIAELCAGYDLDGLELDFMRFFFLFSPERTTSDERRVIITGFIGEVRAVLDRTARDGRRRWLGARIPCWLKAHDALGIDLPAMIAAGLDLVNVSASYYTHQRGDLAAIRKLSAGAALYVELCHTTWTGPKLTPGLDTANFRRTTAEQYRTTAHQAYARGADGVSLFNFAYYREFGGPGRGPFAEPPFEVLKSLTDRASLAKQPQHWFLAPGWNNPFTRPAYLPRRLEPEKMTRFSFDLAPPAGGWKNAARLRVQTSGPKGGAVFTVKFNDTALESNPDISEPFPNPYPPMLGTAETLAAWTVPQAALRPGTNRVEITLSGSEPVEVAYLDLVTSDW